MTILCPCGHHTTDHSPIAGCLADDCACELTPAAVANSRPAAVEITTPQPEPVALGVGHVLAEGRRRRDEGAAAAGSGLPGVTASDWRLKARAALADLIASGQEFSADDLVERAGMPPVANMVGGVFLGAARAKRIRAVGYTQGSRPESHARVQRTWTAA